MKSSRSFASILILGGVLLECRDIFPLANQDHKGSNDKSGDTDGKQIDSKNNRVLDDSPQSLVFFVVDQPV